MDEQEDVMRCKCGAVLGWYLIDMGLKRKTYVPDAQDDLRHDVYIQTWSTGKLTKE